MLINSFGGTGHINLALKALFFHEARQSAAMVQMKVCDKHQADLRGHNFSKIGQLILPIHSHVDATVKHDTFALVFKHDA